MKMISNKKHNEMVFEESTVTYSRDAILQKLYGKRYIDYRLNWNKNIEKVSDIPSFPLEYDLQTADTCNLHCGICHNRKRTGERINVNLLKKALSEGAENGLCSCAFGADCESLIDKDLVLDIVDYARNIGIMDIIIGTNGVFLDSDFSKKLLDMWSDDKGGVTLLNISLDAATPDTYRKIRYSDNYDRVVGNILDFITLRKERRFKLPQIRLSFCKTYVNSFETNLFIEKWTDIVDRVDIQNYISLVGEFQDLGKGKKLQVDSCVDPFRRITILANGDVQCCCAFSHRDIIVGNMYKSSISEIWNGERMKSIQYAFLNDINKIPAYCKTCLNSRYQF